MRDAVQGVGRVTNDFTRASRIELVLLRLLALHDRACAALDDHSVEVPRAWEWAAEWNSAREVIRDDT